MRCDAARPALASASPVHDDLDRIADAHVVSRRRRQPQHHFDHRQDRRRARRADRRRRSRRPRRRASAASRDTPRPRRGRTADSESTSVRRSVRSDAATPAAGGALRARLDRRRGAILSSSSRVVVSSRIDCDHALPRRDRPRAAARRSALRGASATRSYSACASATASVAEFQPLRLVQLVGPRRRAARAAPRGRGSSPARSPPARAKSSAVELGDEITRCESARRRPCPRRSRLDRRGDPGGNVGGVARASGAVPDPAAASRPRSRTGITGRQRQFRRSIDALPAPASCSARKPKIREADDDEHERHDRTNDDREPEPTRARVGQPCADLCRKHHPERHAPRGGAGPSSARSRDPKGTP